MKRRKKTTEIIIHHSLSTFGSAKIIKKWHLERGFADIGYHYVITKDGKLQKGRDLELQGAHARGKNETSIGICLVGDFSKHPPDARQINTLLCLIRSLCFIYCKELKVNFHHKTCPGIMFARAHFLRRLNNE